MSDPSNPPSDVERARALELSFQDLIRTATSVFDQYKIDQRKWWNRMDGTPILNDIAVRMAEAFRTAFDTHTQAVAEFLNEMYATMIDPCEQPQDMRVSTMCAALLNAAREQREQLHNAAEEHR
jgi:hypothetical protein